MAIMQIRHESAANLFEARSMKPRVCAVSMKKGPAFAGPPVDEPSWRLIAQRARVRTWKTSKLSSATCHQRYWSERKAAMASIAFLKSGFLDEISA